MAVKPVPGTYLLTRFVELMEAQRFVRPVVSVETLPKKTAAYAVFYYSDSAANKRRDFRGAPRLACAPLSPKRLAHRADCFRVCTSRVGRDRLDALDTAYPMLIDTALRLFGNPADLGKTPARVFVSPATPLFYQFDDAKLVVLPASADESADGDRPGESASFVAATETRVCKQALKRAWCPRDGGSLVFSFQVDESNRKKDTPFVAVHLDVPYVDEQPQVHRAVVFITTRSAAGVIDRTTPAPLQMQPLPASPFSSAVSSATDSSNGGSGDDLLPLPDLDMAGPRFFTAATAAADLRAVVPHGGSGGRKRTAIVAGLKRDRKQGKRARLGEGAEIGLRERVAEMKAMMDGILQRWGKLQPYLDAMELSD
jgi:hypothetical protein